MKVLTTLSEFSPGLGKWESIFQQGISQEFYPEHWKSTENE